MLQSMFEPKVNWSLCVTSGAGVLAGKYGEGTAPDCEGSMWNSLF